MGGYGSGRRWGSARGQVEACRSLDVRWLQREGSLRPGLTLSLSWSDRETGRKTASIGVRTYDNLVVLSYRYRRDGEEWQDVEEPVEITRTRCAFGGQRPWFVCPCGRRVAILYSAGVHYLCRSCYRLAYACQSEGPADRAMTRARNIRLRLGGSPSLLDPFPLKPKHMRWSTYGRLRTEGEQAEGTSWAALLAKFS